MSSFNNFLYLALICAFFCSCAEYSHNSSSVKHNTPTVRKTEEKQDIVKEVGDSEKEPAHDPQNGKVEEFVIEKEQQSLPELPDLHLPSEARLIAGDLLRIEIAGEDSMAREFSIPNHGIIYYPYIKKVESAGKTVEELHQIVSEKLANFFVDPIVNITVVKWAERRVYVYGTKDGSNTVSLSPTKGMTASQLLISVGVSPKEADLNRISLIRHIDGKKLTLPVPLQELLENYVLEKDIVLQPNDLLIIRDAPKVHIQGNVKSPGAFPLQKNDKMNLWQLLSLADGPTDEADLQHIKILRQSEGDQYDITIVSASDVKRGQMVFLEADDIVVVPSENENVVTVYGQVKKPGTVKLIGKSTRLSGAIAIAGGLTQYASKTIRVFRYLPGGGSQKFTIDFGAITSGDSQQDMELQPGDVVYCDYGLW